MNHSNNRKFEAINNVFLNAIATAIPLLVLQILILPKVNSRIGTDEYGLVVTLISLLNLIPECFGNTLNNVRLLVDLKYKDACVEGDFNVLALILSIISSIAVALIAAGYTSFQHGIDVTTMACGAVLVFIYQYYSVGFRLKLDYKKILIANLLLALGFSFGYCMFLKNGVWQSIYIVGYALSSLFTVLQSGLVCERWHFTQQSKATIVKYLILLSASLMSVAVVYVDRLVLFPLLGGTVVAIYYASTLLGKFISAGMSPVVSVMLSYFSKMRGLDKSMIKQLTFAGLVVGVIGYLVCILVGRPLLGWLYPNIAAKSIRYVYITTLTSIIGMQCSIMIPVVLRFCNTKWQLVIEFCNLTLHFSLSLILLKSFGLMGFCVGSLVAMLLKYFILLLIYSKSCKCV